MGQDSSAPASSSTRTRPERPTRLTRRQQLQEQQAKQPLTAHEQERHRAPTLKEQWQAKREENAATREANAAERKRKKEALHAALMAQQQQAEADSNEQDAGAGSGTAGGGGNGGGGGGSDDEQMQQAQAEAMLTQAQINAQLAAFQTFMKNNPDVEDELDNVDANPASMFNREAASTAIRKATKGGGRHGKGAAGGVDDFDEDAIANVSVHSSDYEDEELMQGLQDLDEELEGEFQQRIDALQAQVAEHKQQSLVFLREHGDKAAALKELQRAKEVEAQIKQLLDEHATPLHVQVEEQEAKIAELENLVATRKQDSLAALRGGDKPTALKLLKEAKGFEGQLEEAKAQLAALQAQKEKQLRSTGDE